MNLIRRAVVLTPLLVLSGCGTREVRPVDLFPEDMCAWCRMAVSDHRVASEIILESGEALKFDDLGCLDRYRAARQDLKIAAVFVKEYDTGEWLRGEQGVFVTTGVFTPMGSGKVAFRDSAHAMEFQRAHPATRE